MIWQLAYEPERAPRPHSLYELSDVKMPGIRRQSFATEAEAHRWLKLNSPSTNKR
jgi:hypothetical protein